MKVQTNKELCHTLMDCITACETCANYCLEMADYSKTEDCIKANRDCADICALTARFLNRESSIKENIIQSALEMCRYCETLCREHDEEIFINCAEKCKECFETLKTYQFAYSFN